MRLGLLSAAWLAGVMLGLSASPDPAGPLLLAGAVGVLAAGLRIARFPTFPAVLAVVLLLGAGRAGLDYRPAGTAFDTGEEVIATGRIADDPGQTTRRVRFEFEVSRVQVGGQVREADERWLVFADPPQDLVSRKAPYFRYGDELTITGTPAKPLPVEGFDYAAYLSARGLSATMFARDVEVTGRGGAWWRATIFKTRGRLAESLERAMPYPESALAKAMLLGKRGAIPEELVEKFRGTGAAHLLAISGLHVGVLLAVSAGTTAWALGRQKPTYLFVAGAVIWLYALVAGAPPSALRAAAMGTVYLTALGLGRPSSVLPALALTAAVMTAVSPNLIRQVSFQLSFAAVGGIALCLAMFGDVLHFGSSPTVAWWRRLLGWAAALLVVSAAATLATWPLVAVNFERVALMSVPVSLLAVPAMAPLVVSAMAATAAGLVFEPLGQLLGWVAVAPCAWVIGVVSAFPSWSADGEWVGTPLLAGWYGGLGLLLLAAQPQRVRNWRRAIAGLPGWLRAVLWRSSATGSGLTGWRLPALAFSVPAAVALGVAAAILWSRAAGGPDGLLHVHFLDVGQGDSILVVAPSGRQALIDGGPDGDVVSHALADTLPGGDRSLDLVVMTHLDSDHSGGLLEVLDRYSVGAVVTGPRPVGGADSSEWDQKLAQRGITPMEVYAGYVINLDDGVVLTVLNPHPAGAFGDSNNDSVVMRLTYGEVSVLLTADVESEAEDRLVASGGELRSTVLKVGHHGSSTSTTERFLEAVNPAIVVVSAGAGNPYGHPAPEVVRRLEAKVGEAGVYRTDRHGSVEIVSDGAAVWVRTER